MSEDWIDRHSVNCYYCGKLFDERESIGESPNDGGEVCPDCHWQMLFPKPLHSFPFKLLGEKKIAVPHPYCITPKHLEYNDSMYLGEVQIRATEEKGAKCDTCDRLVKRRKQDRILSYDEHKTNKVLVIGVPDNTVDLNKIDGLHDYLLSVKETAEEEGYDGFIFPNLEDFDNE